MKTLLMISFSFCMNSSGLKIKAGPDLNSWIIWVTDVELIMSDSFS